MVVHTAMLDYIKNAAPEGFENIIDTHFRYKARSIKAQLDRWVQEDDGRPLMVDSMHVVGHRTRSEVPADIDSTGAAGDSRSAFAKEVEEVKALLCKLEKGISIRGS